MSELPIGWKSVPLREVAAGGVFADGDWVESKDQDPNGGVRLIQLADIGVGRFLDKSSRFLTESKAAELGCTFLEPGDVLVSRMADPIGRACVFPGVSQRSVTVVDVCIVRPRPESTDNRWLTATINSPQFRGAVELAASGTTRSRVSRGNLGNLELPVPPLNEQRRIVAKLEALQARSRRAREALDALTPLLEKLRQSILAAAFRGDLTADWRAKNKDAEPASKLLERIRTERRKKWEASELAKLKAKGKPPTDDKWKSKYKEPAPVDTTGLPELPEGWCWSRFEELCLDLRGGVTSRAQQEATPFKVLRSSSVRHGTIDFDDVSFVEEDASDDFQLKRDDILFTRLSGTLEYVANAAVVGDLGGVRIQYPDRIFRARTSTLVDRQFIASAFGCQHLRAPLEEAAKSTAGHQRISMSDLADLPLPLPSQDEQSVIAGLVRAGLAVVARHRCAAEEIRGRLGLLERSVLATAFRGELVPQAPTDDLAGAASRTNGGIGGGLAPAARSRATSPSRSPRAQIDGDT